LFIGERARVWKREFSAVCRGLCRRGTPAHSRALRYIAPRIRVSRDAQAVTARFAASAR